MYTDSHSKSTCRHYSQGKYSLHPLHTQLCNERHRGARIQHRTPVGEEGVPVDSLHSESTWSAQASTCRRTPRYVNEAPISLLTSLLASISLLARDFFLLEIFARPSRQTSVLGLVPVYFLFYWSPFFHCRRGSNPSAAPPSLSPAPQV